MGGTDAGTYTNSGARIVREGSIVFKDAALSEISQNAREGLFSDPNPDPLSPGLRLIGLSLLDETRTSSVPHGFHLYPVTLGLANSIGGLGFELLATPILALLSTIALYLIARHLGGPLAAIIAGGLFAVNLAQSYFARYPAAEIQGQFLLLSGLLAFIIMYDTVPATIGSRSIALAPSLARPVASPLTQSRDRSAWLAAIFAGALLGLAQVNKIELIAVPVVLGGFLLTELARARWRTAYSIFLLVYLTLFFHTIFHALTFAFSYSTIIYVNYLRIFTRIVTGFGMLVGIAVALAVALFLYTFVASRRSADPETHRLLPIGIERFFSTALSLGVFPVFGYLYFLRPLGARPEGILSLSEVSEKVVRAISRVESLERLGWYLTRPLLLLGILGLAFLIYRGFSWRNWLIIIVFAVEAGVWLEDPLIYPLHFYAARRYLTFLIPGFILFAALLLSSLAAYLEKSELSPVRLRRYAWPLTLALGLLLTAYTARPSLPFVGYVEYKGATDQIASFAQRFPPDAILLFDSQETALRISLPTEFLFDRASFPIFDWTKSDSRAMPAIREWIDKGHSVYWITAATPPVFPAAWEVKYEPFFEQTIDLQETLGSFDHPAQPIGRFRFTQQIYRLSLK